MASSIFAIVVVSTLLLAYRVEGVRLGEDVYRVMDGMTAIDLLEAVARWKAEKRAVEGSDDDAVVMEDESKDDDSDDSDDDEEEESAPQLLGVVGNYDACEDCSREGAPTFGGQAMSGFVVAPVVTSMDEPTTAPTGALVGGGVGKKSEHARTTLKKMQYSSASDRGHSSYGSMLSSSENGDGERVVSHYARVSDDTMSPEELDTFNNAPENNYFKHTNGNGSVESLLSDQKLAELQDAVVGVLGNSHLRSRRNTSGNGSPWTLMSVGV
eukprot:Lankesteria_metandrocarpae@DN4387_c0_g1_i2.p1